ncbi:MAG: hypothetical protein ACFFC7_05195 [Candidatus Hermodarchaeota archaeon]
MDELDEIIIIDNKGEIVLSSSNGGALSEKKQLSAQITQTLLLFADKVVKEPLQFIRFQNSLMVFIEEEPFIAITLVSKDYPASQFLPKIRTISRLLRQYYSKTGELPKKIIYELVIFYYVISLPSKTLIIAEKSGIGLLSVLTFLTGLKADLNRPDIDQVALNNVYFVNENEAHSLIQKIPNISDYQSILSFFIDPDVLAEFNLPTCPIGGITASDIFFINPAEPNKAAKVADLFGEESAASRVGNIAISQEALELADSIAIIPPSAHDPVATGLANAISTPPGEDVITRLTHPILEYLKEISQKREQRREQLELARVEGKVITFKAAPLEVDASGLISNSDTALGGVTRAQKIIIRLGKETSTKMVPTSVLVNPSRVENFKDLIRDVLERYNLQLNSAIEGITFEVPKGKLKEILRSIIWLCFVEYTEQIQAQLMDRTEIFEFPNEGSVMLVITPDYDPATFPSQIKSIIKEEDVMMQSVPWEEPWQAACQIDEIIYQLLEPLKNKDAVAYVPSKDSKDLAEIMQFLVALSDVNGIGFSRW